MKYILTITGASGSGKDSLVDALLVSYGVVNPADIKNIAGSYKATQLEKQISVRELVSHTTRAPRTGEVDGVDYYYIDFDTFKTIEKVEETEYAGNHYCLSADELRSIPKYGAGIVVVDQHGVDCIDKFVREHSDEFIRLSVFLKITEDVSRERMLSRGDKPESIEKRITQQIERHEYEPKCPELYAGILDASTEDSFADNVAFVIDMLNKQV